MTTRMTHDHGITEPPMFWGRRCCSSLLHAIAATAIGASSGPGRYIHAPQQGHINIYLYLVPGRYLVRDKSKQVTRLEQKERERATLTHTCVPGYIMSHTGV